MKLHITRDTSEEQGRFLVCNSPGEVFLTVKGKETPIRKLKALTNDGSCAFRISATPEIISSVGYNVSTPQGTFGVTVRLKAKELSLKIHGTKLFFKGNLFTRTFEITDVSSKTVAVHKPVSGKSGQYTLEILDESQTASLIAIAICADLISFSDSAAVCRA
ncbi:MAG: hypothetical protein IJZ54_01875 [Clostridia bacterium]|nr:hypothetical protein [Clostridia bacterium]